MTAVGQQPMGAGSGGAMLVAPVKGTNQWDQGLLGCCGDFKTMIMAYFCMPCTLCNISSRQGDFPCMPFCVPASLIAMRARIRTLAAIEGSICGDCLATSVCPSCAVCQMSRQLDVMGL